MRFLKSIGLALIIGIFSNSMPATAQNEPVDPTQLALDNWKQAEGKKLGPLAHDQAILVPLNIPTKELTKRKQAVQACLNSFRFSKSQDPQTQNTPEGGYVLSGDLFHTGETYALLQPANVLQDDPDWSGGCLAFAQKVNGTWEIRGLWNIASEWRPKGWKRSETDYLPTTPAEAPFILKDFDGDGIPEIIMTGEIWKYYQIHYLFRFDSQSRTIQYLADAMGEPKLCDGYIRLYFNSGHRDIFVEWIFARLSHGKLQEVARWHDGTPYNEGDDEGLRVEVPNPKLDLKLYKIDVSDSGQEYSYTISSGGTKLATVRFKRKKEFPIKARPEDDILEKAWLFHHLTGLPENLYPRRADKMPSPFSDYESVTLTGEAKFIQLLENPERMGNRH